FTVYGSDYSFATIGTIASRLAAERAPLMRFRFRQHTPVIVEDAVNVLRVSDAMILPHGFLQGLPHLDVLRDEWKVIIASDNPHVGDELTMQQLQELPWVMSYQTRN